jgi:glycosyltransferase involved in cell wall biosynthesis
MITTAAEIQDTASVTTHAEACPAVPWHESGEGRPRFSVVIPAYNEAQFIGDCLDSLMQQEFAGTYEIIVVDNNSSDDTSEVARSRGVTVVHEARQGVCWARQCGTQLATGEIIVSTDADTVYSSDWLSRLDREFRGDPARVAVAGPFRFVDAPWWGRVWAWSLFRFVGFVSRVTGRVPYIAAANIAFLKRAWSDYNTCATQGGDELDLLRHLQSRGRVAFVPDNPVFTSSRRLHQGLAYNIAITFLFYYIFGYILNRLARRPLVGMAPSFRSMAHGPKRRWTVRWLTSTGGCLLLLAGLGDLTVHLVATWS